MSASVRVAGSLVVFLLACASVGSAATPKEIQAAINKGTAALKAMYKGGGNVGGGGGAGSHGIGPTCLAGLALLEAGTPVNDPAVKTITQLVREASFGQTQTYQTSLCLMYLDRLGDPADVPLIQMLAVRLLAGQNTNGGWGYDTCGTVAQADEQRLRAMKPNQEAGKLHPEVARYAQVLFAARGQSTGDDNSNTQFAVLAVWLARKHGVPVEAALEAIEKRFLLSQNPRTGGWGYSGGIGADGGSGSPSMHCAGLIGLATGVARREERRAKDEPKKELKKDEPKSVEPGASPVKKSDDPFFNPPKPAGPEPKKPAPARAPDQRDRQVQLSLAGLGMILADSARQGRGALMLSNGPAGAGHGQHDLYFFWSLERVGVIFGIDKIGGIDWYDAGAHTIVRAQGPGGTWNSGYGEEVDTAFAVLFLCRSNLARDLSSKVQKEISTEMRAGAGPTDTRPIEPGGTENPNAVIPNPVLPGPTGSQAATLAGELLRSSDKDWPGILKKLRDSKGGVHTQALVAAVNRLDGDRRRNAREALGERLARMTAPTLRAMAKDEDAELRRGAVLAMAMKDDKAHIPDLVAALMDDEEIVIRAAKAGLKSLAGQDFGPPNNANAVDKRTAVAAWNEWLEKQKK
jgi:hypothetical protein